MATTYTEHYQLGMQEDHGDKFDMNVITDNAKKIDAALAGKLDAADYKALLDGLPAQIEGILNRLRALEEVETDE